MVPGEAVASVAAATEGEKPAPSCRPGYGMRPAKPKQGVGARPRLGAMKKLLFVIVLIALGAVAAKKIKAV